MLQIIQEFKSKHQRSRKTKRQQNKYFILILHIEKEEKGATEKVWTRKTILSRLIIHY